MSEKMPAGEVVIFFRKIDGEEMFYPVQMFGEKPTECEVLDHVAINEGTLRVECLDGTVLYDASQQEQTQ